ncbi:twin-arginine translocase TatA/TatE family subunit [Paenirhodobacter sp.]|jgi:sec-independent protein translocase protein TatA|uniref:twin-arginine translocase TatA/TatE family subunit n=1 Tax=Paenirhodobacter sp. TaxID=1965326 RepID=UPI003B509FE3
MLSNGLALPHLLLIAVVVLVLFGKGKVAGLMGEVGKGMTAFKRGLKDEESETPAIASPVAQATAAAPADENKA